MSETDHFSRLKALALNGMAQAWRQLQAEAPLDNLDEAMRVLTAGNPSIAAMALLCA